MTSQRTDIPKQAPLAQFQPHGAQTHVFQIIFPATVGSYNAPVQAPHFKIPPGATITLRPLLNGVVNTGPVVVGQYPEQLNGAGSFGIPPTTDVQIPFSIDNLSELWAAVGAGSVTGLGSWGLSIIVTIPAVG